MKCPHCGMNLRDDITECGYCGGKINRRKEKAAADTARFTIPRGGAGEKEPSPAKRRNDDPEMDDEEGGGGLSAILQPGEQVLIGSLNVAVKKFSFHAYLTNQRIFLIDTMEKKLKVTAKDVPRDTIVGSIVEYSESSDPVLVLSLKSGEEDVKTMKLVFAQTGTDRSNEIDEWINLLQEGEPARKPRRKPAPAKVQEPIVEEPEDEEPEEEIAEEEPAPLRRPEKPRPRPELQPARKPVKKDHERQPPVKRLVSLYKEPEEEPEEEPYAEPEAIAPVKRSPVRHVITSSPERVMPMAQEDEEPPVRRPEVQSAMKVAMKGAIRQTGPVSPRPIKKTVIESPTRPQPVTEPELLPSRRPVVQESRPPVPAPVQERHEHEAVAEATPQFCHNCGKKLPNSANFCPGCGTKLNAGRTLPHSRTNPTNAARKMTRTDPPGHESRPAPVDEEEIEEERPVPTRPPVKKAPKGSEMTILHKFLRR
jgi:hypothetical protein